MIESALARPINLASCADPNVADLATAYAFGLAKTHGFVDGKGAPYDRNVRPANAPVCSPCSMNTSPLTITCS